MKKSAKVEIIMECVLICFLIQIILLLVYLHYGQIQSEIDIQKAERYRSTDFLEKK